MHSVMGELDSVSVSAVRAAILNKNMSQTQSNLVNRIS